MDLGLNGKTALVLGGGGGLGRATAHALAREGAAVAISDINADALDACMSDLDTPDKLALVWDLSDLEVIDQQVAEVENRLGPVDILVNITGGPPPTPVASQSADTWSTYFRSMVMSVIAITDRVLPGMSERRWGRIVTGTSSGVVAPIDNLGISNTLRSSLVGWSKTLSNEVGRFGVTSNVVVPGRIATGRITALDQARASREGRSIDEVAAASTATIPAARYGHPHEFADAIAFLASERAGYITGTVLRVDGGMIPAV